ncbi:DNA-directed DNA polymerase [Tanacetum coccineum]|uniref:DNA-directed DNA polymerase n=1 Tax=Tanacetum coccineum TaxID=301880 RepID=A0ABQ5D7M0_9ASTR
MLAIFHDMVKESLEVFMDDFSVYGNSFDNCLNNLDKMLQCCKDENLILNWKKYHFMVKEGIVLGHKNLPFELMCDASEFAVGAVLGQKDGNHFHPSIMASKTLNAAQQKYTITEKELMVVVFAFDTFRPNLELSQMIVYTDHSALRDLFKKQDAKPRLIRWILAMPRVLISKYKDKKGTDTLPSPTTYLGLTMMRQVMTMMSTITFLDETLMEITTRDIP